MWSGTRRRAPVDQRPLHRGVRRRRAPGLVPTLCAKGYFGEKGRNMVHVGEPEARFYAMLADGDRRPHPAECLRRRAPGERATA